MTIIAPLALLIILVSYLFFLSYPFGLFSLIVFSKENEFSKHRSIDNMV